MAKTSKQSRERMIEDEAVEVEKAGPVGHAGRGKEFRFTIVAK